jgi:hypothetical protein
MSVFNLQEYIKYRTELGRELINIEVDTNFKMVSNPWVQTRVYEEGNIVYTEVEITSGEYGLAWFRANTRTTKGVFNPLQWDIIGGAGQGGSTGTSGTSGTSGQSGEPGTSGTSGTSGVGSSVDVYSQGNMVVDDSSILNFVSGIVASTSGTSGQANINAVYNTALDPTLTMPSSVGGIPAGTAVSDLSGDTLVGLIDDLLFPVVLPTYTIPTISLSNSLSGNIEIGSTISPLLSSTARKNDAGAFSALSILRSLNGTPALVISSTSSPTTTSATDIAPQFGYTDPNNPNFNYSLSYTDSGLVVPAPLSGNNSTIVYSSTGNYGSGLAKNNNKGVVDSRTPAVRSVNAPQSGASGYTSNLSTLLGYYPYYYGKSLTQQTPAQIVSTIQGGTGFTTVINSGAGSLSMAFNAVGQWPWFAIFSGYGTKTAWYENALNNGSIGAPTDLFNAPTTLTIISPNGYWTVTYKIYPANKVTTIATASIS